MAAVILDLVKLKDSALMHTRDFTSHVIYLKTHKGANVPYEELNKELYNLNANMLGFRVKSNQRMFLTLFLNDLFLALSS